MKKSKFIASKFLTYLTLSLCLLLCSCKTELIYMTVTNPAPVSLPGYMKKVGVINRSTLSDKNFIPNKVNEVISMKGPELDLAGAKESVRGVQNALLENNRFTAVNFLSELEFKTNAPNIFPSPLSWTEIEKICKDNQIDAVFALEFFQTDSKINYSTSNTTIKNPLGGVLPVIQHNATMLTNVNTGWRIYDPLNKQIVDEESINKVISFQGSGINPVVAAAALLDRKEAVKKTAFQAGEIYASRLIPYNLRVNRDYYVKGNGQFKIAKRMAQTSDWEGAAKIWEQETKNVSAKISARAMHNMAIIHEMDGNLDAALTMAQKAYQIGGKSVSLNYVNILKNRKQQNDLLNQQLEQVK